MPEPCRVFLKEPTVRDIAARVKARKEAMRIADILLDKALDKGFQSLTKEERTLLERQSLVLRENRLECS